jgi:prepilin signal peptidase PulO-like enzyme (type II secretory pathway)
MQMVEIILVLLFGLCFGSFATLAIYRLPRGDGIVAGRSRCPNCLTSLAARDLIPVLSWLLQKGRCRYCKTHFSSRYPLIELATASLFIITYLMHGISLASVLLMLMSVPLIVMVMVDLEHMIIPDEVHLALLVLALGYHAVVGTPPGSVALGFVVMLGVGLSLHYGYYYLRGRDGLGYGDVKFFTIAGIWLGLYPILPFLFLAGGFGVLTGLLWRVLGKGELFPFAPSLALALWVCVQFPELVNIMLYIDNIQ